MEPMSWEALEDYVPPQQPRYTMREVIEAVWPICYALGLVGLTAFGLYVLLEVSGGTGR